MNDDLSRITGIQVKTSPYIPATMPVTRNYLDWRKRLVRNLIPRKQAAKFPHQWGPWESLEYTREEAYVFMYEGNILMHPSHSILLKSLGTL